MQKGERTRQRIVEKAAVVFNQRGYAGTSMADIMEVTGLEKGGLYRHFQNKEELAVAAFDYAWAESKQWHLKGLEDIPSAVGKLHAMIDNHVDRGSNLPGGCPLLNTAIDADDGNPALHAHARAALREWVSLIEQTLEDGIERGEIVRHTSLCTVASVIVSTLEGSVMMARLEGNRKARQIAREHLHRFLDELLVQPQ